MIDGFAKKMADQFFETFQNVVEGDEVDGGAVDDGASTDAAPEEEKKSWLKRLVS